MLHMYGAKFSKPFDMSLSRVVNMVSHHGTGVISLAADSTLDKMAITQAWVLDKPSYIEVSHKGRVVDHAKHWGRMSGQHPWQAPK